MKWFKGFLCSAILFATFNWLPRSSAATPATTQSAATQPAKKTEIWIKSESEMYTWGDLQPSVQRIYRDPSSDKPLEVYFKLGGEAVVGKIVSGNLHDHTDIRQPPNMDYYVGDNVIPVEGNIYKVIIPAGAASVAFELKPVYQRKMRAGGTVRVDLLRPQPETRPTPQTRPTTRPTGAK